MISNDFIWHCCPFFNLIFIMSLSHPFDSSRSSGGNTQRAELESSAPIKPFRLPTKVDQTAERVRAMMATIHNDKAEIKRAFILAAALALIIAGSIIGKSIFTFVTLGLFVLAMVGVTLGDAWSGMLLFIGYLAIEGLYKYTSKFNAIVYTVAPLIGVLIFVVWQISFRNQAAKDKKGSASEEDTLIERKPEKTNKPLALPTLGPLVLSLLLLSFIQAINPESPGMITSFLGGLVWYIAPMSLFFVTYYTLQRFKQTMGLTYTIICVSVVVSAYAIFQYKMGQAWCYSHIPGIESTTNLAWSTVTNGKVESGSFRPVSTSAINGGYSSLSAFGFFAAIAVVLFPRTLPYRRILSYFGLSVMGIAIMVSGVRSVLIAALVAATVVLFLNIKNVRDAVRVYMSTVGVVLLLIIAFVVTDASSGGKFAKRYLPTISDPFHTYSKDRGSNWDALAADIAKRPLGIGVHHGPGASPYDPVLQQKDLISFNNRESQWHTTQGDLGIIGVICLAIFLVGMLWRGFLICRNLKDGNLRAVAGFLYGSIAFTTITTFAGPSIQGNAMFWILCGALLALPRVDTEEQKMIREKISEAMVTVPATVGT